MENWKLINRETSNLFHKIKKVRNSLAHSWHIEHIIYEKNKTLSTNFLKFQSDIKLIWKRLINVYDFIEPQNKKLEEIIKELNK